MTADHPRVGTRLIGLLFAIAAPLCWGAAIVLSKVGLATIPPAFLLTVEIAASSSLFWTVALRQPRPSGSISVSLRHGWLGILEPGLAYLVGLFGLRLTDAGEAALVGTSESLMILALSALFFKERIGWRKMGLAVLAVIGLAIVLGLPEGGVSLSHLLGDGLYALGALCASLYVVLSARRAEGMPVPLMLAGQQTVALVFMIVVMITAEGVSTVPPSAWGLAALIGVIQNGLAFLFFFLATKRLGTTIPAIFLTLAPLAGLGGGMVFLGETLSAPQAVGGALTLAALVTLSL